MGSRIAAKVASRSEKCVEIYEQVVTCAREFTKRFFLARGQFRVQRFWGPRGGVFDVVTTS